MAPKSATAFVHTVADFGTTELVPLRRGNSAANGTDAAADQGASRSASPATGQATNRCAGAGADQPAADRALARIIRVGAGRSAKRNAGQQNQFGQGQSHRWVSSVGQTILTGT
jgi:hypothetical protein